VPSRFRLASTDCQIHLRDWPCSFGPSEMGKAELGGKHPVVAARCHRAPDDFFRAAGVIHVRCVDEIDAGIERLVDDAARSAFVRLAAEHHGAQAEGRHFQGTAAEIAMIHFDPVRAFTVASPGVLTSRRLVWAALRQKGMTLIVRLAGVRIKGSAPPLQQQVRSLSLSFNFASMSDRSISSDAMTR
jgi:hypothetical protein